MEVIAKNWDDIGDTKKQLNEKLNAQVQNSGMDSVIIINAPFDSRDSVNLLEQLLPFFKNYSKVAGKIELRPKPYLMRLIRRSPK